MKYFLLLLIVLIVLLSSCKNKTYTFEHDVDSIESMYITDFSESKYFIEIEDKEKMKEIINLLQSCEEAMIKFPGIMKLGIKVDGHYTVVALLYGNSMKSRGTYICEKDIQAFLWNYFNKFGKNRIDTDKPYHFYNIRYDRDNIEHNNAIVADVLLEVLSPNRLSELLNKKSHIEIEWSIDSIGNVKSIKQSPSADSFKLTMNEVDGIYKHINSNCIQLPYCLNYNPYKRYDKYKNMIKEYQANGNSFIINTCFPTMTFYKEDILSMPQTYKYMVQWIKRDADKYKTKTIVELIANKMIEKSGRMNKTQNIQYDRYFFEAYDDLSAMIDCRKQYNSSDANFIIHSAYGSGKIIEHDAFMDSLANIRKEVLPLLSRKEEAAYSLYLLHVAYIKKHGTPDVFSELCKKRILETAPQIIEHCPYL